MTTNRGIWRDGLPMMSEGDRVAAEVNEAFTVVDEWRRYAPVEKSSDGYLELCSIPITLVCWGWDVSISQNRRGVKLHAAKVFGHDTISATVTGLDLPDALWCLGQKLRQAIESSGRPKPTRIAKPKKESIAA
jgi:hypothetical protein